MPTCWIIAGPNGANLCAGISADGGARSAIAGGQSLVLAQNQGVHWPQSRTRLKPDLLYTPISS